VFILEAQIETDRAFRAQIETQRAEMIENGDFPSSPMAVSPISTPNDAPTNTKRMQFKEEWSPGLKTPDASLETSLNNHHLPSSPMVDPSISMSDTPKRFNRMQFMEEWSPELSTPQALLQTSLNSNGKFITEAHFFLAFYIDYKT
jgi:hypothetical protein